MAFLSSLREWWHWRMRRGKVHIHGIIRRLISIEGPVELVDGNLMIRIPVSAGGAELAPLARGIGEIEGEHLCVLIKPWLAEKLRIGEGSLVIVDDRHGKFTITRSARNDEMTR